MLEWGEGNFSLVFVAQLFILLFYPLHCPRLYLRRSAISCLCGGRVAKPRRAFLRFRPKPRRQTGHKQKIASSSVNFRRVIVVAIKTYYVRTITPTITVDRHPTVVANVRINQQWFWYNIFEEAGILYHSQSSFCILCARRILQAPILLRRIV